MANVIIFGTRQRAMSLDARLAYLTSPQRDVKESIFKECLLKFVFCLMPLTACAKILVTQEGQNVGG